MFRYALLVMAVLVTGAAWAEDRREGYYYPPITSEETFERVLTDKPVGTKEKRVELVITMARVQASSPTAPNYIMFEKGDESDELIFIALDDQVFKTLYRARAVMAHHTDLIRGGRIFQDGDLKYKATFYDMLVQMGFKTLTISDGETWTHRVTFKSN